MCYRTFIFTVRNYYVGFNIKMSISQDQLEQSLLVVEVLCRMKIINFPSFYIINVDSFKSFFFLKIFSLRSFL